MLGRQARLGADLTVGQEPQVYPRQASLSPEWMTIQAWDINSSTINGEWSTSSDRYGSM